MDRKQFDCLLEHHPSITMPDKKYMESIAMGTTKAMALLVSKKPGIYQLLINLHFLPMLLLQLMMTIIDY